MVELKKIPYKEWRSKFDRLMENPYLAKKYNRQKRIKDHRKYMTSCTPEIKLCKGKLILDIGPGPGEWLEICREFGHRVIGIDARLKDSEMGDEYIQLSQLMTLRQKILVDYVGFENHLLHHIGGLGTDNSVFYINMRGSIEQCFKNYMSGTPHRITKKASGLTWIIDNKLKDIFYKMFAEFERILEPGGYVYIWANGSTDDSAYNELIQETLNKFPTLKLYSNPNWRQHKIRKVN